MKFVKGVVLALPVIWAVPVTIMGGWDRFTVTALGLLLVAAFCALFD